METSTYVVVCITFEKAGTTVSGSEPSTGYKSYVKTLVRKLLYIPIHAPLMSRPGMKTLIPGISPAGDVA